MLRRTLAIGFATIMFLGSPAFGAALEDGRDAYQKGDYAGALKLLRPLADAGNPEAQVYIGLSYEFGDGVAKNTAEAVKWYRQAAEKGSIDAAYNLGTIYEEGNGVPKNMVEALKWFRQAAAKGHSLSQRELGSHRRIDDQPPEAPDELVGGPENSWLDGRIRRPRVPW